MVLSLLSVAIIVHCLITLAVAGVQDVRYQTSCTFNRPRKESFQHDCHVALFSYKHINFTGKIVVIEDDFCTIAQPVSGNSDLLRSQNLAVMVKRGNCAFSTKALNAQQTGFQLVIIVNSEEEGFPVGPPELDFVLEVPVAMVGLKVWEQVYDSNVERAWLALRDASRPVNNNDLVSALEGCHTISLNFAPAPLTASPDRNAQSSSNNNLQPHPTVVFNTLLVRGLFTSAAAIAVLILVMVFYSTLRCHFQQRKVAMARSNSDTPVPTHHAAPTTGYATPIIQVLVYVLIVTVFVGLRLGTLRIYSTTNPLSPSEVVYNHRETDERVFEALLHNVLNNLLDYRLHPHAIQELHLAEENYSDSVFIHPPLFVFLSAGLHRFCTLPIPLIPIVLQTIALCLLPVISQYILSMVNNLYAVVGRKDRQSMNGYFSEGDVFSIGITAMLILSCCPIAAFSSQKFWIDNCLLLSVTVCTAVHVVLLHLDTARLESSPSKDNINVGKVDSMLMWRHALSGIIFGLVGLNCKITAVALLLFLVGWSFLQQYLLYQIRYEGVLAHTVVSSRKHTALLRHAIGSAIVNCVVFGLCALLAYAPWMYIYWIHTGRLSPNAWPSATMLQRSSFVRAAVNKPWYTYLYTLTSVAPVHLVGLVGTIVLAVCSVSRVVERVMYGVKVLWGGDGESVIRYAIETEAAGVRSTLVSNAAPSDGSSDRHDTASGAASTTPVDRRASLRRRCKEPSAPSTTSRTHSVPSTVTVPTHEISPDLNLLPIRSCNRSIDPFVLTLLVFALWPVGFLVGLTVLGSAGSGFQSRFLMPMLPGSAILSALCIHWVHCTVSTAPYDNSVMSSACNVVVGILVIYSMMYVFYYGVLYAPLFADLDVGLVEILCSMLQSVYSAPASREEFHATLKFMSHYGLRTAHFNRVVAMARYIPGPAGQSYSVDTGNEQENLNLGEMGKIVSSFEQGSWLKMRHNIEARNESGIKVADFRDFLPVTLADVVDGTYDLRVPRLVALVTSITTSASGDWVLELQDPTGSITGFISTKHMAVLQDRKLAVGVGNTVLLEQVSIFVSAAPVIRRHLCLHSMCFTAVWG